MTANDVLWAEISADYRVLAIDPGEGTGVVWWAGSLDAVRSLGAGYAVAQHYHAEQVMLDSAGEVGLSRRIWTLVERVAAEWVGLDALVLEDFILYPGAHTMNRSELSPVRITAQLEWANLLGVDGNAPLSLPIMKVLANESKGSITDERLRRWGCWIKGQKHSRDAMRLLLYHLRKVA